MEQNGQAIMGARAAQTRKGVEFAVKAPEMHSESFQVAGAGQQVVCLEAVLQTHL